MTKELEIKSSIENGEFKIFQLILQSTTQPKSWLDNFTALRALYSKYHVMYDYLQFNENEIGLEIERLKQSSQSEQKNLNAVKIQSTKNNLSNEKLRSLWDREMAAVDSIKNIEFKIFLLILRSKTKIKNWLENPTGYELLHYYDSFFGGSTMQLCQLTECACQDRLFNRKLNDRRKMGEEFSVNELEKRYPPKSDFTLHYLSLGSGGLLQDFINIAKLIDRGYNSFCITLIESNHSEMPDNKQIQLLFFLTILKITYNLKNISVRFCNNIKDVKLDQFFEPFHYINAIDFDELYMNDSLHDIVETHKWLAENGLFFLSVKQYDLIFGTKGLTKSTFYSYERPEFFWLQSYQIIIPHIAAIFANLQADNKTSLNYTCMTPHFLFQIIETINVLSLLQSTDISVNFTLRNLINEREKDTENKENNHISIDIRADYENFIRLLVPGLNVKVSLKSEKAILEAKSTEESDLLISIGEQVDTLKESHTFLERIKEMPILGGEQFIGIKLVEKNGITTNPSSIFLYRQNKDLEQTPLTDLNNERKSVLPSSIINDYILMPPLKDENEYKLYKTLKDKITLRAPELEPLPEPQIITPQPESLQRPKINTPQPDTESNMRGCNILSCQIL